MISSSSYQSDSANKSNALLSSTFHEDDLTNGSTIPSSSSSSSHPPSGSRYVAPLVHNISPRTAEFARRVAAAKGVKLTFFENCVKGLGYLMTIPFLGLNGFFTVPANTRVAIFRFGKLDKVITKPGIHWLPLGYDMVSSFAGQQTTSLPDLHVIDAAGNPIIIRALLEYTIEDPAALQIATNSSLSVLLNMAEQTVREACSKYPLLGAHGEDIRSHTADLGAAMVSNLQADAQVFGISIQRLIIVEARYAPEIAAQMLMKQQAQALIAARTEIVNGSLAIVKNIVSELPTLSKESQERLINSMLITLTSHQPATPVFNVSGNGTTTST